ncbi:dihydrolipoyl dehydrogenase [candidate division KSB1 bacterium]|nr:dihydrolipoyl dehydrogenase [candidate division KSB1 bacterium]
MEKKQFDLAVIGAGPGGYVAAIRASQLGMKVVVIEKAELGGVCLNWGCIPTKALLRSAEIYDLMQKANRFGLSAENVQVNFQEVVKRSRQIAERSSKGIAFLFKKNNIIHVSGAAKFGARNMLQVTDAGGNITDLIQADKIIIATGARPRTLPGLPFDGQKIISSREAMSLEQIPESLIIIGAGAIGVEFAYLYSTFGTKVTLIEMLPQLLPIEDEEISQNLLRFFRRKKINTLTSTKVEKVAVTAESVQITAESPQGVQQIQGQKALVAIGVQGNTENLGLDVPGILVERGYIKVDQKYETNVPGIYAIGDVIGPPWLAHVASAEGIRAVEGMVGKSPAAIDYNFIPGCTYCQPQVASIGLTETKALEKGLSIKVGRYSLVGHGKALALGENDGLVKLIFDANNNELLGAHLIGPEVTELLAEICLAKTINATAHEFLKTIHAHPTLSEAVAEAAAAALGEAIHV